ncbi:MAG: ribonuclease Y [Chthonomonas sp.]|nr:ribonuclease Y [Chthonomonas sp.]
MNVSVTAFVVDLILAIGFSALITYVLMNRRIQAMREREVAQESAIANLRSEVEEAKKLALLEAMEEEKRARERLEAREEKLEERTALMESQEAELHSRSTNLNSREADLTQKMESLAGLNADEARALVLAKAEAEAAETARQIAKTIESEAAADAQRTARKLVIGTMERAHVDIITESTVAVVTLPSEEMKGRIIGREGRNIRAFEQVAGVDLIVDDTPETVVISCFDPIRRETARLALMNLMVDGRIHPGRIEELYEKAQQEVQRTIRESGERACDRAQVAGLPSAVIEQMGALRFRSSYAQNVLDHSVEVAQLAAHLAAELGCNEEVARTAGFLHDIGKALGSEYDSRHAIAGMQYLEQQGLNRPVRHAVGAHHREIEPETEEAQLVIIADSMSASRPGARRENLDNYVKRLGALEAIANSFEGVERSFAVQAGRELRLIVRPNDLDDAGAAKLAKAVAKRIETETEYPGQVKITVIREVRISEVAK